MTRLRLVLLSIMAVLVVGAVASASASATPYWEVCNKHSGAGTKYPTNKCKESEKGSGEYEWLKLEAGESETFTSSGEEQQLIGKLSGLEVEVRCSSVSDVGTIKGGEPGTDEATVVYHGCKKVFGQETSGGAKVEIKGCEAKSPGKVSGQIELVVDTKLVEYSAGKIGDEFTGTGTEGVFVEIELGKEETSGFKYKKACALFPKTAQKVYGSTIGEGEVGKEGNLCEKFKFGPTLSSLKFGTETAVYDGAVEDTLTSEASGRCAL